MVSHRRSEPLQEADTIAELDTKVGTSELLDDITIIDDHGYFVEHRPPNKVLARFTSTQLISLSGALSGLIAGVAVCPLDVVKTRLQASSNLNRNKEVPILINFINQFSSIVKNEGFKGLYRGVVPTCIGYLPTWAIYFTVYERTKLVYPQLLYEYFGIKAYFASHFSSAITAGIASSIAVNPIWVVKTRLMVQRGDSKVSNSALEGKRLTENIGSSKSTNTSYRGTWDAFKTIYREEGIRLFYSGITPSLFGLVHVGIHFPVYEKLKNILHCDSFLSQVVQTDKSYLWRFILASSLSKMIASTLTYPHEILRTRLQIRGAVDKSKKGLECQNKKGLFDIIRYIYHNEGIRGFYSGYGVNLIRTVPASAITLVSFEYFRTYLLESAGKL